MQLNLQSQFPLFKLTDPNSFLSFQVCSLITIIVIINFYIQNQSAPGNFSPEKNCQTRTSKDNFHLKNAFLSIIYFFHPLLNEPSADKYKMQHLNKKIFDNGLHQIENDTFASNISHVCGKRGLYMMIPAKNSGHCMKFFSAFALY